jgi:hypothetical protein
MILSRFTALLAFACVVPLAGCAANVGDNATGDGGGFASGDGGANTTATTTETTGTTQEALNQGPQGAGWHFILITTRGGPVWNAWYDHWGSNGQWAGGGGMGTQSSGKKIFWYYSDGKGHLLVHAWVAALFGPVEKTLPDDRDHCFVLSPFYAKYTGDSLQGCNPH